MRSPAPAGPHSPATSTVAENSGPWWPTYSHPGPDAPAGGQVGTFRIFFAPLRLRCPVPDTVPESRQEQPLPPLYKTLPAPLSQTGTIVAQAAEIENRFWKGRRKNPCMRLSIRNFLFFDGIPGFVAAITALLLFARTPIPDGSSALLPSTTGCRLLRSVYFAAPHLIDCPVPRFL